MKLWKEILIQYALIIGIFNIIVYTDNYGGASNYYFLVFPMLAYMILMPGINDLINKSNKTILKNIPAPPHINPYIRRTFSGAISSFIKSFISNAVIKVLLL